MSNIIGSLLFVCTVFQTPMPSERINESSWCHRMLHRHRFVPFAFSLFICVTCYNNCIFSTFFIYWNLWQKRELAWRCEISEKSKHKVTKKSRLFKFFLFIKVTEAICLQKIDSQCMKRRQQLLNVADKVNIGHVSLETFVLKARWGWR